MKNLLTPFLAFLFVLTCNENLFARDLFPKDSLGNNRMQLEIGYGRGFVNFHHSQNSVVMRASRDNYFLTARFVRSQSGLDYIFENNWLAGYRFNFSNSFNATFSAGAGDIAFVDRFHGYNEKINHETVGLTLDLEVQARIKRFGIPTPWYFYANYYTTFNDYNNLNGITYGLLFKPTQYNRVTHRQIHEKVRAQNTEAVEAKKEKHRLKEIQKAENIEHNDNIHSENYAFAGRGKRPFNGGFGMLFEFKKIVLGANFTWESQIVWTENFHPANYPPSIMATKYFKGKQSEKAIFAGYRIWENSWIGLTVAAGPVWRKNTTLLGREEDYRIWYDYIYSAKTTTGLTVQTELSYTFRNRAFGFGLIPFVNVYSDYVSAGAVVSMRVGFLR